MAATASMALKPNRLIRAGDSTSIGTVPGIQSPGLRLDTRHETVRESPMTSIMRGIKKNGETLEEEKWQMRSMMLNFFLTKGNEATRQEFVKELYTVTNSTPRLFYRLWTDVHLPAVSYLRRHKMESAALENLIKPGKSPRKT